MADAVIVTCPNCKKKFKPKSDVRGKRIKCPFCKFSFVVPAVKDKAAPDAVKAGKPKGAPETAVTAAQGPKADDPEDLDGSPDPYGVKQVELVPRCPNCTEEMGEHDIICLACGYNTMTREWGKTEKTYGVTFGRHLRYLLPALGAAVFNLFWVIALVFYATNGPYLLTDPALSWLDSEAMRMWITVISLFFIFGGGLFCFKKFIEKPKPDEIEMT